MLENHCLKITKRKKNYIEFRNLKSIKLKFVEKYNLRNAFMVIAKLYFIISPKYLGKIYLSQITIFLNLTHVH